MTGITRPKSSLATEGRWITRLGEQKIIQTETENVTPQPQHGIGRSTFCTQHSMRLTTRQLGTQLSVNYYRFVIRTPNNWQSGQWRKGEKHVTPLLYLHFNLLPLHFYQLVGFGETRRRRNCKIYSHILRSKRNSLPIWRIYGSRSYSPSTAFVKWKVMCTTWQEKGSKIVPINSPPITSQFHPYKHSLHQNESAKLKPHQRPWRA